eukprot:2655809-Rhodomonas_salina.1
MSAHRNNDGYTPLTLAAARVTRPARPLPPPPLPPSLRSLPHPLLYSSPLSVDPIRGRLEKDVPAPGQQADDSAVELRPGHLPQAAPRRLRRRPRKHGALPSRVQDPAWEGRSVLEVLVAAERMDILNEAQVSAASAMVGKRVLSECVRSKV